MISEKRSDQWGEVTIFRSEESPRQPVISVIMGVKGSLLLFTRATDSILNQTFRDFEFLITLDGIQPELSVYCQQLIENDPRVILIQNSENVGLTKSLYRMVELSKGKYIARQDADDISLSTRFKIELEQMTRKGADVVFARSRLNKRVVPNLFISRYYTHSILKYGNPFVHGTMLAKKEAIARNYNPAYRYAQDYELFCFMATEKRRISVTDEVLYELSDFPDRISVSRQTEQSKFASEICLKYFGNLAFFIPGKSTPKRYLLSALKNVEVLFAKICLSFR